MVLSLVRTVTPTTEIGVAPDSVQVPTSRTGDTPPLEIGVAPGSAQVPASRTGDTHDWYWYWGQSRLRLRPTRRSTSAPFPSAGVVYDSIPPLSNPTVG